MNNDEKLIITQGDPVPKTVENVETNFSLFVGKLNMKADSQESEVKVIPNLNVAFKEFEPSVEVDFKVPDQEPEILRFDCMDDFEAQGGEGKLVQKSTYLSGRKNNIDIYTRLHDAIQSNAELRAILNDAESRGQLREVLQQMLEELQNNH